MFENKEDVNRLTEAMLDNRDLLVQFALANEIEIINTMCKNS